jgi:hypothetical protein
VKDERLYAKFTQDFPDHPKIMPLSDKAFRCLVEATMWSRSQMTDGFLPSRYAVARWGLEPLQELATNDPQNPSLIVVNGEVEGWQIHDFAAHQDTKADVIARRERNKRNGQKGGLAKAKRLASELVSETVAETETETETKNKTVKSPMEVVTSVGRTKRGTRLDPNWMPPQSIVDAIKAETGATREELRTQHARFVDYWTDKAGQSATKVAWDGTWRNWMRTAASRGEIGKSPVAATGTNGRPHKLRVLADLANEVREMENTNGRELEA